MNRPATSDTPDTAAKTLLLAGASGVIGRRLCRLLVADGWQVFGTTRSPAKAARLRALGVEAVVVDVFDASALHRQLARIRPVCVVHQLTDLSPGLDPAHMPAALERNARLRDTGTRHLVDAAVAAGVTRMVAQSLAFCYAPGASPLDEHAPLNTAAPGLAGITARGVARLEQHILDAPLTGVLLRYGRLYGPDTGFDAPSDAGTPLHVDDAADAARRAITRGPGGIYNIAEEDGTVSIQRARQALGWAPGFRLAQG